MTDFADYEFPRTPAIGMTYLPGIELFRMNQTATPGSRRLIPMLDPFPIRTLRAKTTTLTIINILARVRHTIIRTPLLTGFFRSHFRHNTTSKNIIRLYFFIDGILKRCVERGRYL